MGVALEGVALAEIARQIFRRRQAPTDSASENVFTICEELRALGQHMSARFESLLGTQLVLGYTCHMSYGLCQ